MDIGAHKGVAIKYHHFDEILRLKQPPIFEILTDNYLYQNGIESKRFLDQLSSMGPFMCHGVGLNLGSCDPLDLDYLKALSSFCKLYQPSIVSDHACFTGVDGYQTHDLLPLPRNEESATLLIDRVKQVQSLLGRPIAIENVSRYLAYEDDDLGELEWLQYIASESNCKILLDVNNLYVSSFNESFCPYEQLKSLEAKSVSHYHIAGHKSYTSYLFDSHDEDVIPQVLDLLWYAFNSFGPRPVILERDDQSSLSDLMSEWKEILLHDKFKRSAKIPSLYGSVPS